MRVSLIYKLKLKGSKHSLLGIEHNFNVKKMPKINEINGV